ncbi:MAG: TIGR00266 family protein [Bacilli bacterium]|nr:TIGR00266 family protein [Bacilli bacterium]
MKYEISGLNLPYVEITLNKGETIHTERGAMSWMSETVEMKTNAGGSIGKALSRALSGESIFQNTYTATKDGDIIGIASSFPGQILAFDVSKCPIIAQKRAFLAREDSVKMDIFFNKKLGAGFFGGEGFIMQKFSGSGIVFLEVDGSLIEKELAQSETLILNTGYLVAMTEGVTMDIVPVKGVGNVLFGGEGLFNTKVTGPGKLWIQSCPVYHLLSLFTAK